MRFLSEGSETLKRWNSYIRKFASESGLGETVAELAKTAKWKMIVKWPRLLFRAYGPRFATPREESHCKFCSFFKTGLVGIQASGDENQRFNR